MDESKKYKKPGTKADLLCDSIFNEVSGKGNSMKTQSKSVVAWGKKEIYKSVKDVWRAPRGNKLADFHTD